MIVIVLLLSIVIVIVVLSLSTSPYHPQTNGLDERIKQTLSRMLVKLANEKREDWDLYITDGEGKSSGL